jgi:hypothetical protein
MISTGPLSPHPHHPVPGQPGREVGGRGLGSEPHKEREAGDE